MYLEPCENPTYGSVQISTPLEFFVILFAKIIVMPKS